MDVTGQIRQLELAGFAGDELDHAVALAGSAAYTRRRLPARATALLREIQRGARPKEALQMVEGTFPARALE